MGKTCEPKAFSFQCMTKFTTKKKKKKKLSILVLFLILKEKFSVFKNSLIILDALFQPTYIFLHCLPKIKESVCPTSPWKVFSPFGVQFCWLFYNLWKHNNFVDLTFSPLYMMRNTFEAFHSLPGSRIASLSFFFFFLFYAENYPNCSWFNFRLKPVLGVSSISRVGKITLSWALLFYFIQHSIRVIFSPLLSLVLLKLIPTKNKLEIELT